MDNLKQREQELEAEAKRINAGRKPKFGDLMRNPWASDTNPHRDGYFVRQIGTGHHASFEFTDRKGRFWEISTKYAFFLDAVTSPAPAVVLPVIIREALEATFEQRPGHLTKVAAAIRALPDDAAVVQMTDDPIVEARKFEMRAAADQQRTELQRMFDVPANPCEVAFKEKTLSRGSQPKEWDDTVPLMVWYGYCEFKKGFEAAAALASQPAAQEHAEFAQYLKEGETPIQRLVREIGDSEALAKLLAKERARFEFLHSTNRDASGWEWGVARVRRAEDGRIEYLWGASDHSDIDAARLAQSADKAESDHE